MTERYCEKLTINSSAAAVAIGRLESLLTRHEKLFSVGEFGEIAAIFSRSLVMMLDTIRITRLSVDNRLMLTFKVRPNRQLLEAIEYLEAGNGQGFLHHIRRLDAIRATGTPCQVRSAP